MVKNFDAPKQNINNRKNKKDYKPKITNESLLQKFNYVFTRDAEWFKKTCDTINKTKDDLDNKFYNVRKEKAKD